MPDTPATATQAALDALEAAIVASLDAADVPVLPAPRRNQSIEDAAEELAEGSGVRLWLNLLDGRQIVADELLGAGNPSYEIEHRAVLEWVVVALDDADREAAFHAGIAAIEAALDEDRTLAGTVDDVRLLAPAAVVDDRHDGGSPFKSADIPVDLLFTSDMPV